MIMFFADKKNKSKYANLKVKTGKLEFDSKLECRMYMTLVQLPPVKKVKLHTRHSLVVNDMKICTVLPDFEIHLKNGTTIYADAKSAVTETTVSSVKFKLFKALFGKKVYIIPRQFPELLEILGLNPDSKFLF